MANFYFNGTVGDTYWDNTNNWYYAPQASSPAGSLPTDLDDVFIETPCNTNVPSTFNFISVNVYANLLTQSDTVTTINCPFYVTNDPSYGTSGSLSLGNTLINNGTIYFTSGSSSTLAQSIANYGSFYIYDGTNITASFANYSNLYITDSAGTTIYNLDNFAYVAISNSSVYFYNLANGGTIDLYSGTVHFYNNANNISGAILNNYATLIPFTLFTNGGTINIYSGGNIITQALYTTINNGTINCTNNAAFTVDGTFTNNASIIFSSAGRFSITPGAVVTNNGSFQFGSTYSTNFRGRIFPQVPSSASWGNALL